MKVIVRAVLDWDGSVLEETSYEYSGPIAQCKSSGSAPTPTDPYAQADAQMGLAKGTAGYNAALNRTNSSNAVGSSGWNITGTDPSTGAPLYSQSTQLQPWAQNTLSSPIDTKGLAGMPGGPSTTQDLNTTRNALYNTQMNYLAPQQAQQSASMEAQLAAQGATPGSEAWKNSEGNLGRQQTFANDQAINSAITGGGAEQSRLFGLGSQGLQNQLAVRNAPISEFQQLQGNGSGGQISAATPDISGAFGQQYQGALAGYNANTATNNANTQGAVTTAAMAAMMFY